MTPIAGNRLIDMLLALCAAGVDFVVCGGVACILQGVARATHDLDVRVDLTHENLERLIAVAREQRLRPRIPEPLEALLQAERRQDWVERKRAVVYTLVSERGDLTVDVFLQYPLAFAELVAGADVIEVRGTPVRVSSKLHLIEAKRRVKPQRKVDLRDIEDLTELLHGTSR